MHNMEHSDMDKSRQTKAADSPSSVRSQQDVLKAFQKELLKTTFFLLAALAVLVYASKAWFVSNSRVHSGTASVSAQYDPVRIASKGVRQSSEEKLLNLPKGTAYQKTGDSVTYYYTESGEIALRLSEEYTVSPGASGSIDFYIIPTRDGAMTVTLYLGLAGYTEKPNGSVERVKDDVLDALLSGHILLFDDYDGRYYSNWLGNPGTAGFLNNSITVTLPEDTKEGNPVPVTLYWIWPLRYENMVEDLYAPDSTENRFQRFLEQAQTMTDVPWENSKYKYSRIFLTKGTLDSPTKAYNLADEYIGTNAGYLYLTIQTASFEDKTA